jgi:hypothetical protein
MTTLGYWTGALYELATYCKPRIGWRSYQRWHLRYLHGRDLLACLLAITLWAVAAYALGA